MEEGGTSSSQGILPTKNDQEFRPFVRRLPEFKFWYSATKAVAIGFVASWFSVFDVPVFWPVLVVYWILLFVLTSKQFYFPRCEAIGLGRGGFVGGDVLLDVTMSGWHGHGHHEDSRPSTSETSGSHIENKTANNTSSRSAKTDPAHD